MSEKAKFYFLQNVSAGYVGNSPVFWEKSGSGYTQWIDEAKKFTADECKKIIHGTLGSHKWKRWPVSFIERRSQRTVDCQKLAARKAHP